MLQGEDKISIIVPIYNVEKYLRTCIESLTEQTYKNIEIILVDDGSPDACPTICDDLAKTDDRINVFHKKNGGLSDARNFGIDHATGKYICFVDSDDMFSKDAIEKLYSAIKKADAQIAACNFSYMSEGGKPLKAERKFVPDVTVSQDEFWNMFYTNGLSDTCVIPCNKLFKKELFDLIRFKVGKIHEDQFIIHHLISQCDRITFISDKLYFYRHREESITGKRASINHLDEVEAYLERAEYMNARKNYHVAKMTVTSGMAIISKIYVSLDKQTRKANRALVKEKKHHLDALATGLFFKKFSLRYCLKTITFRLGIPFYVWLSKMAGK